MKREDITNIFENATKEQIDRLLDLNSADTGKALSRTEKLQSDLDAANEALKKAQETIAAMEANQGDIEKLQKEIEDYKAAETRRIEAEKAATARADVLERMDAVMDGRQFVHERMRDLVADDFAQAISDKAYRGKADKEIFDAITKDKGYFASQNPPAGDMGQAGEINGDAAHMAAVRAAMGLPALSKEAQK